MRAYEAKRAIPTWRALLLLGLCLVGIDVAVALTAGWDSFGGAEQGQTFSRLELASAKARALATAQARGARVGLVVGMSTADWGIDSRALEGSPPALRYAKVTGEFSSFRNLLDVVKRLDVPGFAPDRTLLCVHYGMLLGARRQPITRAERLAQIATRLRQTHSSSELSRSFTLSWLGNNRAPTANALETRLGAWHERLLLHFGQSPSVAFSPLADPFQDSVNARGHMHASVRQRHVESIAQRWRRAEGESTGADSKLQAAALGEMVRLLRRGGEVVVVLMPEHSELRAVVPEPLARARLDAALGPGVRVIDLRGALPDDAFADEVHVTGSSRGALTTALKRAL